MRRTSRRPRRCPRSDARGRGRRHRAPWSTGRARIRSALPRPRVPRAGNSYPGAVTPLRPPSDLVGAGTVVPCLDGIDRPYRDLDCAASTPAMQVVAEQVAEFLPWYSSVHRGAGYKSRQATAAYESARESTHRFAGRPSEDGNVVVLCRNTTEAINHLAYRLRLAPDDVVVTTVVEHHANLLPWARVAATSLGRVRTRRHLHRRGRDRRARCGAADPALLAITGASNVTGWLPPIEEICAEAHARGVPVLLDAAQLAPHRRLPPGPDFVAFSGHKLYAPYGAGALIGPRRGVRHRGSLPRRRRGGRPGRPGRGDLDRAARARGGRLAQRDRRQWPSGPPWTSWSASAGTRSATTRRRCRPSCTRGCAPSTGVHVLGPGPATSRRWPSPPSPSRGCTTRLVAARLSAEFGIGVRHGCFCAHPYLLRLLGVGPAGVAEARAAVLRGDRSEIPGAVRASCGLGTSGEDVDALLAALRSLAGGTRPGALRAGPGHRRLLACRAGSGVGEGDRPAGAACARG